MNLRPRRRRGLPLAAPPNADPAVQSATLRRLIDELNGTVESLWWDARWACTQLALARNGARADIHPCCDVPPAPHRPQPEADATMLRGVVDDLNSTAEALWWEAQWARAELAAAVLPEPRLGRGFRYG
jgi:hypothetical protein